MFEKLFYRISDLGKLPFRIVVHLIKQIFRFVKNIFKINKSSASSKKVIFRRCVVFVLIAGIITGSYIVITENNNNINAICIQIDGKIIGYTNSQTEADNAVSNALKILGSEDYEKISKTKKKVEAYEIKTASDITDSIIKELSDDYVTVYEVYVGDELLGVITDAQKARNTINNIYSLASKVYSNSTASFSKSIKLVQALYPASSETILSNEELQNLLADKLQIIYAQCEKTYAETPFEVVEVQTNKLFLGDSRIRRAGENGKEYNINLVTYIDNQKVYSEKLMSFPVTASTPQIVERGIRANSLSMGSYTVIQTTGMFCWPAVDLYTVTSPYGNRSLGYHKGIDISGASASGKLVVAGAAGTVTEAGWSTGGYGYYVIIDHGNGVETLYAHMLENSLMVNAGDTVFKGQAVGRVGNTGYSFGAHLHFEVRINGNKIDPAPFLGLQ